MMSKAIHLEVQFNEPLVPRDMTLKNDTSTREGSKDKLLLDLIETSKESFEEEEEPSKDLLK